MPENELFPIFRRVDEDQKLEVGKNLLGAVPLLFFQADYWRAWVNSILAYKAAGVIQQYLWDRENPKNKKEWNKVSLTLPTGHDASFLIVGLEKHSRYTCEHRFKEKFEKSGFEAIPGFEKMLLYEKPLGLFPKLETASFVEKQHHEQEANDPNPEPGYYFYVNTFTRVAYLTFRGSMYVDDWMINLSVEGDDTSPVHRYYTESPKWKEEETGKNAKPPSSYVNLHFGYYRRAAVALADLEVQLRTACNCGALEFSDIGPGVGRVGGPGTEWWNSAGKKQEEKQEYTWNDWNGENLETLHEKVLSKYKTVRTITIAAPPMFSTGAEGKAIAAQRYLITGRVPPEITRRVVQKSAPATQNTLCPMLSKGTQAEAVASSEEGGCCGESSNAEQVADDFIEQRLMRNTANLWFNNDLIPRLAHLSSQEAPILLQPVESELLLRQERLSKIGAGGEAPAGEVEAAAEGQRQAQGQEKVLYRTVLPVGAKAFFVYLSHLDETVGLGENTLQSSVDAHLQGNFLRTGQKLLRIRPRKCKR
eukprot:g16020.t1